MINNKENHELLKARILKYLKQPLFVVEGLNRDCDALLEMLNADDCEDVEEAVPEPEDYSRANHALFETICNCSICDSCHWEQPVTSSNIWHLTRLFLMGNTRSKTGNLDQLHFDILTASSDGSWKDLCIQVSK